MSAALYTCLFFWGLQITHGIDAVTTPLTVGSELSPPQNVMVISLNTKYTLGWEWHQSRSEREDHVTFTAQYVGYHKLKSKTKTPNWFTVCEETSHRSCDLTSLNLHYLGKYVFRVRANVNRSHSEWATKVFCPEKDAVLGPPAKVVLAPAGSDLEVIISEPMTSDNTSMRKHIEKMYYLILYWKHSPDSKTAQIQRLSSMSTVVILPNLTAWQSYCVTVQSRNNHPEKNSSFTSPLCMQTEGTTPWWQIVLYFLGSLFIFFLVVLLSLFCSFKCYKTVKKTFFPSNQLPTHLQKYLCGSPASDFPGLLTPCSETELLCDKVTVCVEPAVLEIYNLPFEAMAAPPSGLELDNSGRHSRQDSGSSGDSGVYSAGGSSGLRQYNNSRLPLNEDQDLWPRATTDHEQVKMHKMTEGLKSRRVITEEGVVDMCV